MWSNYFVNKTSIDRSIWSSTSIPPTNCDHNTFVDQLLLPSLLCFTCHNSTALPWLLAVTLWQFQNETLNCESLKMQCIQPRDDYSWQFLAMLCVVLFCAGHVHCDSHKTSRYRHRKGKTTNRNRAKGPERMTTFQKSSSTVANVGMTYIDER